MKDFLDLIVWGAIHSLAVLVGMNSHRTVPHRHREARGKWSVGSEILGVARRNASIWFPLGHSLTWARIWPGCTGLASQGRVWAFEFGVHW